MPSTIQIKHSLLTVTINWGSSITSVIGIWGLLLLLVMRGTQGYFYHLQWQGYKACFCYLLWQGHEATSITFNDRDRKFTSVTRSDGQEADFYYLQRIWSLLLLLAMTEIWVHIRCLLWHIYIKFTSSSVSQQSKADFI